MQLSLGRPTPHAGPPVPEPLHLADVGLRGVADLQGSIIGASPATEGPVPVFGHEVQHSARALGVRE